MTAQPLMVRSWPKAIQCHQGAGSGTANHANAQVNVAINATWGGSYSGTTTPGDAYGTCSNVYCHSTVQGITGTGAGTSVPRAWGAAGPLGCAGCHKNMATDATATGSHAQHVQSTAAYTCDICHGANYTNTTVSGTALAIHSNKVINLSFTGAQASGTTYVTKGNSIVPGSAVYSTCTTSNCHGTVSPTWGANTGATQCEKCHGSATTAAAGTFEITAGTTNTAASVIHVSHLNSSHNYSSNIACAQCHTEPAAVNDAAHIDTALPAEVPMAGALARTGGLIPAYNSGTKTCSNMYCHGKSLASNNPTPPTSTDVDPAWTATFLGVASVVGNGNNTPGSGDCAKCHAYPPMNGAAGTHTGKIATDCITCHTHVNAAGTGFGDVTKHINGAVEGGTCNSCHGYEEASWPTATQRAVEGKGAHAKHVAHLVHLWGGTLNPQTDLFGSGASWTNVCGVCHNGATHNTAEPIGGNGRLIVIPTTYQFGPSAPLYSGIPATSSSVNPKSCSSVSCHFNTTPVWSPY